MRVDIFYLNQLNKRIRQINDEPLHLIEWYDQKTGLHKATKEEAEEWKFVGLSNIWFAREKGWIK